METWERVNVRRFGAHPSKSFVPGGRQVAGYLSKLASSKSSKMGTSDEEIFWTYVVRAQPIYAAEPELSNVGNVRGQLGECPLAQSTHEVDVERRILRTNQHLRDPQHARRVSH